MRPLVAAVIFAGVFLNAQLKLCGTYAEQCVSIARAWAQTAPTQGPTFRTGIDVITLDVAAVDAQGRPVDGLLASEFSVRIDGRPRRIVSVEQVKFPAPPEVPGSRRRPPVAERVETFFS